MYINIWKLIDIPAEIIFRGFSHFLKDWGARLTSTSSSWGKFVISFFALKNSATAQRLGLRSFMLFQCHFKVSLSVLIFCYQNPTSWKGFCCVSVIVSHLVSCRRIFPVKSRSVQQAYWGNSCLLCSLSLIIALIFETVKVYNKFHFIEVLLSAKVQLFKIP